jgi:hypothetical protein
MSLAYELSRRMLPASAQEWLGAQLRRWRFHRLVRVIAASRGTALRRSDVRSQLVRNWGNPLWVAQDEYLEAVVEYAMRSHGPILECGSGLSTIVLALIAQERDGVVWTLEHNREWAAKVQHCLSTHRLTTVHLLRADLRRYGDYWWYDAPLSELPGSFSLVVCDGPPGTTRGGRYGLLPVMRQRLAPGCTILLDDAGRPDERDVLARWCAETAGECHLAGKAKPYGILIMPTAPKGRT